jgi:hypothetical protein
VPCALKVTVDPLTGIDEVLEVGVFALAGRAAVLHVAPIDEGVDA